MPIFDNVINSSFESIDSNALIRLVYTSSPTIKTRINPKVFESIEADSCGFNKVNEITGVLCYGNGHFLQCIEGEKTATQALLSKIIKDERHKGFKVIYVEPIEKREFSNWNMKLLFLERWIWSPETRSQADSVSEFLPFDPDNWTADTTEKFIEVISKLDSPPNVKHKSITFNALGNMIQTFVGPHQAFIFVQLVLLLLAIIIILILYKSSHF